MSGRRLRNLLLLALVAGIGYWIYRDRPTLSGIVDTLTSPLLGSRAAVKSSERNRVVGDASTAISEQVEGRIGSVREGMSGADVRELLGDPDKIEKASADGVTRATWTYKQAGRIVTLANDRVVSISLLQ